MHAEWDAFSTFSSGWCTLIALLVSLLCLMSHDAIRQQMLATFRANMAKELGQQPSNGMSPSGADLDADDKAASIATLRNVNRHLNSEVETLTEKLATVTAERDSLQLLLSQLGNTLDNERRTKYFSSQPVEIGEAEIEPESCPSPTMAVMVASEENVEVDDDAKKKLDGSAWDGLPKLRSQAIDSAWLIDMEDLEVGEKIGSGSSGSTYRATFHGATVCAKKLNVRTSNEARCFLRELTVLSRVRSPHIVPFVGGCLEPPGGCYLVTELMEGGNLKDWLKTSKPLEQRLQVALDIARGMQALEEASPACMHRDLKPSNVLLDAIGRVRIADFSLARYLPKTNEPLTGETGTYLYMAPEVIRHEPYTGKADVYSFGILLNELVTANPPYADLYLTPIQVAYGVTERKLRPTVPPSCNPGLAAIMQTAWDADPATRPPFSHLVRQLEHMLQDICRPKDGAPVGPLGFLRLW